MNKKRILITRTDRLGDVVLSTPVIRALRSEFPDAYIAFMVRPENRDVVAGNKDLDEVIIYDKYGEYKNIFKTILFARSLRKRRFDAAIALHPTNRAHIIMFFAGIKHRIGYDRKMGFLLTKKVKHLKQEGGSHEAAYNLDMLKAAGMISTYGDIKPYITTTDNDKRLVDAVMNDNKIGGNIIAIHAGASCPSKRWPAERFADVADALKSKYNADIVLVGGDDSQKYSDIVVSEAKNKIIDLTGMFLIGELAEFLSRCRLFISNDSGPVHVAVAVNTSVIDIFGRNDKGLSPERWGPLGEEDIVLHKDPGCLECLAHNCEINFKCLDLITADDVISAAEKILKTVNMV